MSRNCVRYFVDPNLLKEGIPVEFLEKIDVQQLPYAYDALFSTDVGSAKKNKEKARKWLNSARTD